MDRAARVLAEERLFGQLRTGGRVEIDADTNGLRFAYVPVEDPPEAAQRVGSAADAEADGEPDGGAEP